MAMSIKKRHPFWAGCLILAFVGEAVAAPSAGPFATLSGSWSGGGAIAMADGHRERIRCSAAYQVVPSGLIMHQNLRCASDSYSFDINSSVQADDDRLSGSWTERTRQVSGDVTGQIQGNAIATSVKAVGFSATLDVVTRGNAQAVSIRPEGSDVQTVEIQLTRR